MLHRHWTLPLAIALAAAGCAPKDSGESGELPSDQIDLPPTVVFQTNRGRITMELDREKAPETVANFLLHVRGGFYNGLMFHRVRPGSMIQAGALTPDRRKRTSPTFPIANEADNQLLNLRATVAMARTSDPHSATSEFFINLKDNPALDFNAPTALEWGYAVFGRVTEGMDVVDAIARSPTERWSIYEAIPLDPVVIDSAFVAVEPAG